VDSAVIVDKSQGGFFIRALFQTSLQFLSVSFAITVHEAPNDVEAFGLEVWFDPNILTFESCEKGELANQFILLASTPESGVVRVAGIAPNEGAACGAVLQRDKAMRVNRSQPLCACR